VNARRVVGRLLLAAGAATAFWRSAVAVHWFREWLQWRATDPSAAKLYEINFWFEVGNVVFAAAVAAGGGVLARSRAARPARPGFVEICRPAGEVEIAMIRARLDATDIQYYIDSEFSLFRVGAIGQAVVLAEAHRAADAAAIVREIRGGAEPA